MMQRISFRAGCALGFVACAFALAFALYLQHGRGFEPCAMCVSQRVAMLVIGLVLLAGAVHAPKGGGRWVYASAAFAAAAVGGYIAARQVWLQHLPPDQVPACGPTMGYVWKLMPHDAALSKIAEMIFKGDGDCAKIDAQWLGISLPEWTLMAFAGLALYIALLPGARRKETAA